MYNLLNQTDNLSLFCFLFYDLSHTMQQIVFQNLLWIRAVAVISMRILFI